MIVAIKLSLDVSFAEILSHKGELLIMSWAKETFFKLQEREGKEHQEKQRQSQERSQILAEAPAIWNQLTRTVSMNVAEFSELRPGFMSMTDQSQSKTDPFFGVSVASNQRQMKVTFNVSVPSIHYAVKGEHGAGDEGSYSFKLSDGEVMLHDQHRQRFTVSDAASILLNHLV